MADSTDSDDSDLSKTQSDFENDSDSDSDNVEINKKTVPKRHQNEDNDDSEADEEEEEEDELIKAIRRESQKVNDHPPQIKCDDFITDISFHPHEDILAVANVEGDVIFYKYSIESNTVVQTLEVHPKSCRDIEFSQDGNTLFSAAMDKSIMLTNTESGKLIRFYDDAHGSPIYCLSVIDENLFATGDDDGEVKLWDIRQKGDKSIFRTKKNEDYISDIITNEHQKYLVCSSGDGSLTTIDLQNRTVCVQSEEYDEDFTCLGLFRSETKLVAGSINGKLLIFNWNEFGLHSDMYPGSKSAINSLLPITEDIVVTACDDGNLRAVYLFPHRPIGIVGQHDFSIENLDISNNGKLIASSSHDKDIKFWNIEYFEEFEKISHKKKKRKSKVENNLPSSKRKNVSDFFSDLV